MKRIIFVPLLVLIIGCVNVKKPSSAKSDESIIKIDFNPSAKKLDLSTIVDSTIQLIPLETNDNCLISEISKLEFINNKFFILDYDAKSIFIFDKSGKYLSKIFNVGNGPGQYIEITAMTVMDSLIIIVDNNTGKQIFYDYQGNLKHEARIFNKIWTRDLFFFNDMIYYKNQWSNSNYGKYRLYSSSITSPESFTAYLGFEKEPLSLGMGGVSYSVCENNASLIYNGCDTIFTVLKDGSVKPKFYIDFNGERVQYKSGKVENVFSENTDDKIMGINCLSESNKYLFINVETIGDSYVVHYNKVDSTYETYDEVSINKNWGNIQCNFKWCFNDDLVQVYPIDLLLAEWKYNYSKKSFQSQELRRDFESIIKVSTVNSNPVLFMYHLK